MLSAVAQPVEAKIFVGGYCASGTVGACWLAGAPLFAGVAGAGAGCAWLSSSAAAVLASEVSI